MGQYLTCGIAQNIIIENKWGIDNKKILENLGENIDLNLYNIIEETNYIYLAMKRELFEKYVVDFIIEQSKFFYEYNNTKKELQKLKGLKYDELINIAKEQSLTNFQFLPRNVFCNYASYLTSDTNCRISCDIISFIGDGKVYLECYYDIFTYLRNCIINSSNNPIRTSTVITISG